MATTADIAFTLTILFADIINGIIKQLIILFGLLGRNKLGEAIATVVVFILMLIIVIVVMISYILKTYIEIRKEEKPTSVFCISGILQLIGVLLYFIGSNINYIIITYGDTLGCTNHCSDNVRYASIFLLGMAVLFYNTISTDLNNGRKNFNNQSGDIFKKIPQTLLIPVIKVAVVYKTVASGLDATCSEATVTISSIFLCICTLVGAVVLIPIHTFNTVLDDEDDHDTSLDDMIDCSGDCLRFILQIALYSVE